VNFGNQYENRTAEILRAHGYLVASLRHSAGAGDLLALPQWVEDFKPLLIEVKGTRAGPWMNFRVNDREAMLEAAYDYGVEPMLAWYGIKGPVRDAQPVWLPSEDWPT
jgi:hypothetical protein